MTPVATSAGRRVALFGLGGSGLSTLRALVAGGAEVAGWDDREAARGKAAGGGFAIVGDVELFARERAARAPAAPFVAITGTNGKSTTTALIAHVLRQAGREVAMGGNIGVPILDLPPPSDDRVHVIECSSFQIDLAPSLAPGVGLLINVTPDHLDRHGTVEAYSAIKERLVAKAAIALVGVDDEPCRAIAARLRAEGARRLVTISAAASPVADVWIEDPRI